MTSSSYNHQLNYRILRRATPVPRLRSIRSAKLVSPARGSGFKDPSGGYLMHRNLFMWAQIYLDTCLSPNRPELLSRWGGASFICRISGVLFEGLRL